MKFNKVKALEAKILDFYFMLDKCSTHIGENSTEGIEAGYWKSKYLIHFGISVKSEGTI